MRDSFKNKIVKVNVWPIVLSVIVALLLLSSAYVNFTVEDKIPNLPIVSKYLKTQHDGHFGMSTKAIFADGRVSGEWEGFTTPKLLVDKGVKFEKVRSVLEAPRVQRFNRIEFIFKGKENAAAVLSIGCDRMYGPVVCGPMNPEESIVYLEIRRDHYLYKGKKFSKKALITELQNHDGEKEFNLIVDSDVTYDDFVQLICELKVRTRLRYFYLLNLEEVRTYQRRTKYPEIPSFDFVKDDSKEQENPFTEAYDIKLFADGSIYWPEHNSGKVFIDKSLKFKQIRKVLRENKEGLMKAKFAYKLGDRVEAGLMEFKVEKRDELPDHISCGGITLDLEVDQGYYRINEKPNPEDDVIEKLIRLSSIDPTKVSVTFLISPETTYGSFMQFMAKVKQKTKLNNFHILDLEDPGFIPSADDFTY